MHSVIDWKPGESFIIDNRTLFLRYYIKLEKIDISVLDFLSFSRICGSSELMSCYGSLNVVYPYLVEKHTGLISDYAFSNIH